MISNKYRVCFLALVMVIISMPQSSYAQTSRDSLNQYVADLQKNPNDFALRTKIILLAQTIKPAPAIPDEVERFMIRGKTALELAKESKDYSDASAEFIKARDAAPWVGNIYFNLAVVRELEGNFAVAINDYKYYLLAEPDATDAKEVKTKIYELEYKGEKAKKEQEKAKAQQYEKDLVKAKFKEFKAMVQGKAYYGSTCHKECSPFCIGCNLKEANGSYWRTTVNTCGKFTFPGDSIILFEGMNKGNFRGTPNANSITWEQVIYDEQWKIVGWKPIWIKILNQGDYIKTSTDRPADDVGFNEKTRYDYTYYSTTQ